MTWQFDGAGGADGQSPDISAPTARSLLPSSVGMTFGVTNNQSALTLDAHWGLLRESDP